MSRISVVIATHSLERWTDLVTAVTGVRDQSLSPRETIVVVDRNPDLLARARDELDGIIAVENDRFPGAGGARNAGCAHATGDVLAFIDDDVRPDPGWLAELARPFSDPGVLGVGGTIAPDFDTARPGWFPDEFDWVIGCTYRGLPKGQARVRNLIGANMSMRRDRFEQLGGFRENFGKVGTRASPEETDLCVRASQRWPEMCWLHRPEASVRHRVPAGRVEFAYFVRRCWHEGIGKADMATVVGAGDASSSEREYVRRVLPAGFVRNLGACLRGDGAAGRRAGSLVAGLVVTAAGFIVQSLRLVSAPRTGRAIEPEIAEHYEIERELAGRLRAAGSREERRRLYGEVYRERNERIPQHPLVLEAGDERLRAASVAPQARLIGSFARARDGAVLCEIGAGDGAVAEAVAPTVARAVALDVTDAIARPSHGNYEFRRFDGFDFGLSPGSIDIAYSNDVAEHLHEDDLLEHARAVHDALRPGGVYVCVTPNRLAGPHDISRHFSDVPLGFHLREYTVGELAAALRAAGFARTRMFVSVRGRRLTPLLPVWLVRPVEGAIARLPARARRRAGVLLTAVKVAGVR